jgi:hypothetical protein
MNKTPVDRAMGGILVGIHELLQAGYSRIDVARRIGAIIDEVGDNMDREKHMVMTVDDAFRQAAEALLEPSKDGRRYPRGRVASSRLRKFNRTM